MSEAIKIEVNESLLIIKNDTFGNYGKPNAVVKPMQRIEQPFSDKLNSANQNKFSLNNIIEQRNENISIIIKDVENQLKNHQNDKHKSSKNVKTWAYRKRSNYIYVIRRIIDLQQIYRFLF